MQKGRESVVKAGAEKGIRGMDKQLERLKTDPEILQRDLPTLLENLKRPGTFAWAYPQEVYALLRSINYIIYVSLAFQIPTTLRHYNVEDLNLKKLFPEDNSGVGIGVIYPKKSPWKAPLDIGKEES